MEGIKSLENISKNDTKKESSSVSLVEFELFENKKGKIIRCSGSMNRGEAVIYPRVIRQNGIKVKNVRISLKEERERTVWRYLFRSWIYRARSLVVLTKVEWENVKWKSLKEWKRFDRKNTREYARNDISRQRKHITTTLRIPVSQSRRTMMNQTLFHSLSLCLS